MRQQRRARSWINLSLLILCLVIFTATQAASRAGAIRLCLPAVTLERLVPQLDEVHLQLDNPSKDRR